MTSALRSKVITARKDPFVLLVHPPGPSEESSRVQLEELNFPIAQEHASHLPFLPSGGIQQKTATSIMFLSKRKQRNHYLQCNLQSLQTDTILPVLMQWKIKWRWGVLDLQTASP